MSMQASGTFEVTITPQGGQEKTEGATLGRSTIAKRFQGDLAAESSGEMLTAVSAHPGSAAYGAVERVPGSLLGQAGSFALTHKGTMTRGTHQLSITVVPDSGTGA